ncbi:hypothetical protein PR202_ga09663 [Eleusine coracana subsp. coracana]|uniref:MACPF domain-containing protein n=1 Tax=Eleusine coracana subsp. coracana TaxID=191504 RepID=A0AAV5C356_ELECO|nr:hypothetical protein PR202_ga09663 [Eleusine coracana subsp. coracana]
MSLAGSVLEAALQAVGRGIDAAGDHRLLYCKGAGRLVELDEARAWDFTIEGGAVPPGVPADVDVEQYRGSPERIRPASPVAAADEPFVCSFPKMAEHFNRKAGLLETVPLGNFNSQFSFTGSWKNDAAATKSLAIDGYSVPLFRVKIMNSELTLLEGIKRAIPYSWDPSTLASFIENYGTHIITSVTVGGKDEVYIKQHSSSQLSELEFKNYVREIGKERFSDVGNKSNAAPINYSEKDMTVIFRRRGGCDLVQSFSDWKGTVTSAPDVIGMTFLPIVSLVDDIPGKKHLARAVDLYLTYKPPIEELQYFLDFQVPVVWAPAPPGIAAHNRKEPVCPSLQFSLMGPKLLISTEQISVGRRPVIGLRLCLEGAKQNRLAIHLQHLALLPKIFLPHWDSISQLDLQNGKALKSRIADGLNQSSGRILLMSALHP